jgi:hypothetical protein
VLLPSTAAGRAYVIMGKSICCHQLHLRQCMQTLHRFGTLLCLACLSTICCCLCRAKACKPSCMTGKPYVSTGQALQSTGTLRSLRPSSSHPSTPENTEIHGQ